MRLHRIHTHSLYLLLSMILLAPAVYATTSKPFVIVLDAGHGGHDSGNTNHGFIEKNIALNITLKVGATLEKNPLFEVIYTRKKDVYLTLAERAEIANKAKADFFVSIHLNSVGGGNQAYGVETFVLGNTKNKENLEVAKRENSVITLEENYEETYGSFDPNSPSSLIGLILEQEEYLDQSIQLAGLVQNNITKNLHRRDRSVKQNLFYVLAYTYMPSILIEAGFLSNRNEGAYLNSAKGQTEMAREISNAILEYRNSLLDLHKEEYITAPVAIEHPVEATEVKNELHFMVQIGASGTKMETAAFNFKGLEGVQRVQEGSLYKYFYGQTSTYQQAQQAQETAKQSGFPDCFIVAYKNGVQVRLADVLKTN